MVLITYIADADALISLLSNNDANHQKAKEVVQKAVTQSVRIIFPATAITEAITTMHIRLSNPSLAKLAAEKVATTSLSIAPVDASILEKAVSLYNPEGSKKNTMFDAVVAATAMAYDTKTIFSFDGWYKRLGFTLAGELV